MLRRVLAVGTRATKALICLVLVAAITWAGEGRRACRSRIVGTIGQYPTRTDALRAVEPFRIWLNLGHRFGRPIMLGCLIDRYSEQDHISLARTAPLPSRSHSRATPRG